MIVSRIALVVGGIGGLVAAFALFSLINIVWLLPAARSEGRDGYIASQAVADRKAELERNGDDATLQTLSDYDLCVAGLRGNRMPVSPCDQLRGNGAEQLIP